MYVNNVVVVVRITPDPLEELGAGEDVAWVGGERGEKLKLPNG